MTGSSAASSRSSSCAGRGTQPVRVAGRGRSHVDEPLDVLGGVLRGAAPAARSGSSYATRWSPSAGCARRLAHPRERSGRAAPPPPATASAPRPCRPRVGELGGRLVSTAYCAPNDGAWRRLPLSSLSCSTNGAVRPRRPCCLIRSLRAGTAGSSSSGGGGEASRAGAATGRARGGARRVRGAAWRTTTAATRRNTSPARLTRAAQPRRRRRMPLLARRGARRRRAFSSSCRRTCWASCSTS